MILYSSVNKMSILLDQDCKRMLRQPHNKLIIYEVLDKLSLLDKKNLKNQKNIKNLKNENNFKNLYHCVLTIFGCDKY